MGKPQHFCSGSSCSCCSSSSSLSCSCSYASYAAAASSSSSSSTSSSAYHVDRPGTIPVLASSLTPRIASSDESMVAQVTRRTHDMITPKEMTQPCLLRLHVVSLIGHCMDT